MDQSTFNSWLEHVWDLRWRAQIHAAEALVREQRRAFPDLSGPPAAVLDYLLQAGLSASSAIEFMLLDVSFLRPQLRLDEADRQLAGIQSLMQVRGIEQHYQCEFQRALNAFARGQRDVALEAFNAARLLARNEREEALALFNTVICLEDLGFDYQTFLAEFEQKFRPCLGAPWAEGILHQINSMQARSAYRQADVGRLTRYLASPNVFVGDQAIGYLALVAQLPFFEIGDAVAVQERAIDHLLRRGPQAFLAAYQVRTLSGLSVSADLAADCPVRATEQIERFYLWTWRWLIQPDDNLLDKILRLRDHLRAAPLSVLSTDDFLQLENAVRWLGLFLGLDDRAVRQTLDHLSYSSRCNVPVLTYEQRVLDYLVASRGGDAARAEISWKALIGEPCHEQSQFTLPALVTAVRDGAMAPEPYVTLHRSLDELLNRNQVPENGLAVDVHAGIWKRFAQAQVTDELASQPLCQLLWLASRGESWHVCVLLQACFGLPRFDPIKHDVKIAKLLAMANRLCNPEVRFSRKGSYCIASIKQDAVHVRTGNDHTRSLASHPLAYDHMVLRTVTLPAAPAVGVNIARSIADEWVNRRAIEAFLGCSRTVAVERINRWYGSGLLEKSGTGKATRYRLSESLLDQLASGSAVS